MSSNTTVAPEINRTTRRESRDFWAIFSSSRLRVGETIVAIDGDTPEGDPLGVSAPAPLIIESSAIELNALELGNETIPAGRAVRYRAHLAATATLGAVYEARVLVQTSANQFLEMITRHTAER